MANRPWSAREIAVLTAHADDDDWLPRVRRRIRGRTLGAIKVKMAKLRGELGYHDAREVDGQSRFEARAIEASAMLLARLEMTGLRP